jgi:hypothetical protein
MVSARAIGLVMNDPQRGHVAFHALRDLLTVPTGADAIGVASCVDASVLVTRRPTLPPDTSLASLVGTFKGRFAVVQVRTQAELRPPRNEAANIGPFRGKTFAAAVSGGPQDHEAAASSREKLLVGLPDFLRRMLAGQTEGEAFFAATLAELHERGALDRGIPAPGEAVVAAVRHAQAKGIYAPRQVTIATGAELVHVSFGVENAIVRLDGLNEADASTLDPTLADSSIVRERLRRFRAVFTLGVLDHPLEDTRGLPASATLLRQKSDVAVVVGGDLEVRTV